MRIIRTLLFWTSRAVRLAFRTVFGFWNDRAAVAESENAKESYSYADRGFRWLSIAFWAVITWAATLWRYPFDLVPSVSDPTYDLLIRFGVVVVLGIFLAIILSRRVVASRGGGWRMNRWLDDAVRLMFPRHRDRCRCSVQTSRSLFTSPSQHAPDEPPGNSPRPCSWSQQSSHRSRRPSCQDCSRSFRS